MQLAVKRPILSGYGERVARFGQEWIVQTKGRWAGQALNMEPWQRDFLDELFLVYDNGDGTYERVYREALLGISRKNGKSTLSAAIALYLLVASGEQGPEVYVAASTKDQARIVFNQAREFILESPRLSDWLQVHKDVITCRANHGVFRVLASDAGSNYGLNPSGVVIDELWAHKSDELYFSLTTGQLARESPLVVNITTAGFDRDTICYQLYERGREIERTGGGLSQMRKEGYYFKWYEADPDATVLDPKGWEAANPSSWIREEDLAREAKRLPDNVFRRLHMNQWTESEDAWIKPYEWDACAGKPLLDPHLPFETIATDVAFRRDAAAIVWTQWHGNRLHIGQEILQPEDQGAVFGVADVRGRLASRALNPGGVKEMPYDPWNFRESAEILAERGLPMLEFTQGGARMGQASETLYELIVQRRLVHDGDPLMKRHVLSAVATPTDRGGWQISKRKSLERIDGCVALAMAADRAVTLRTAKTQGRQVEFA